MSLPAGSFSLFFSISVFESASGENAHLEGLNFFLTIHVDAVS
jgi:hypothetical protein